MWKIVHCEGLSFSESRSYKQRTRTDTAALEAAQTRSLILIRRQYIKIAKMAVLV